MTAGVLLLAFCFWAWESRHLPSVEQIRTRTFSRYIPKGRGAWMPLWAISQKLQTAVVAWEDPLFYHHSGINLAEIGRSFWIDLRTRSYRRGASTISQQVARNLFLSQEKTLRRKFREVLLARRLERALSKAEILTIYLNVAEWGKGIVGAEAASHRYFGKPAADLQWSEAALLAGILPNPRSWNPCTDPARARDRRHAVLTKLLRMEKISRAEFESADATPVRACCP